MTYGSVPTGATGVDVGEVDGADVVTLVAFDAVGVSGAIGDIVCG